MYPNETVLTEIGGESQTLRGMWDEPTHAPYFVDLRPAQDDKTVLRNPHKGWFWHYIDNGLARGAYRDRQAPDDDLHDFPGLNHLYLRFDWGDIERRKGVYDFSPLDEIMETWGRRGYTFAMRVCTFEGEPNMEHATPAYVYGEGARCFRLPNGRLQPDYSDPVFLERLECFLRAMGEKYDGDPRIEYVDIGTYGTWGEGHTVEGDNIIYPVETVKRHFALSCRYFPHTFLLCNDDHIIGRMAHGQAEVEEMLDYAEARGFGLQDDSVCLEGYTDDCGYDTLRAPWAFDRLCRSAPCAIELCHYTYIRPRLDANFRGGLTVAEALKDAHATFAGFHGYPRDWLPNERYLTEYCANRLGYWYFLSSAVLPPLDAGAHNRLRLTVENRGWARAYHPFTLRLLLEGCGVCRAEDQTADNRTWLPGRPETLELSLDCSGLARGDYRLSVGLFEGERPVQLAMKPEYFHGGWYTLGPVKIV